MSTEAPASRADLTAAWTRDVCKIGQGHDCCRYLTMGADGWNCEKHTGLGLIIDGRVSAGEMTARGDNCPGLPGDEAL